MVLTGRIKDTIVLSNGENVEPEPIELACVQSPFVRQMMVVGQDAKQLGALVVPDYDALMDHEVPDNAARDRIITTINAPPALSFSRKLSIHLDRYICIYIYIYMYVYSFIFLIFFQSLYYPMFFIPNGIAC